MRLIDADAIQIPKTGMEVFETCRLCETAFPKVVNEIISNAPTIEPKRGEWIALGENDISGYWECSACGSHTEAFGAYKIYKYCPFCGADMRGEHNE